jgi:hypothetical protein
VPEQIALNFVAPAKMRDHDHRGLACVEINDRAGRVRIKVGEIAMDPPRASAAAAGGDDDVGFQKTSTVTLP